MIQDFKVFTLNDVVKFNDYHIYPFKGITKRIEDEDIRNCDILYWEPLEPIDAPFSYYKDSFGHKEFSDLLIERNIKIYAVYSDYDTKTIQDSKTTYIPNLIIIKWKTSLLNYCRYSAESVYGYDINNIKVQDTNFKKLFNCLNRGVRPARVTLLDELYKNDLFDFGEISWNLLTTDSQFIDYNLSFKYWKEKRLKIDLDASDISDPDKVLDFHLWSDYYLNSSSLISIQSESIMGDQILNKYFLSEKTWKPLILGKPFIMLGPPGYYKYLQTFGFKLYDEIFDYSFDIETDETKRIKMIVSEINKLKNEDYIELYKKIKKSVLYNRNLAISITDNDSYIDESFINLYKKHKNIIDSIPPAELNMDLKKVFGNLK